MSIHEDQWTWVEALEVGVLLAGNSLTKVQRQFSNAAQCVEIFFRGHSWKEVLLNCSRGQNEVIPLVLCKIQMLIGLQARYSI